jgi:hypothetical protein
MRALNGFTFFRKDMVCTSRVYAIHGTGANVVTANRGPLAHPGPNIVPKQPQNSRPREGIRSPLQHVAALGREKSVKCVPSILMTMPRTKKRLNYLILR